MGTMALDLCPVETFALTRPAFFTSQASSWSWLW
jgi:hypothetical protein